MFLSARVADVAPVGSLGPVFELDPSGTLFNAPVTVTYHYQSGDLGGA